ncbi:DUF4179 domain-containing protein [Neobacillus mesonae]|uniref:DUF4179 domain-containing protein n=1 Tax=Neobacillus mesonae TaxID=1193713 RepID=UPI0025729CCA|nr:DUF4179 domain-containing protein [Neobacillus mesonae]
MIPAKQDPILITTIRENGAESIVDWFEQHKQSFYILGWCYLRNQQQIEELFYRSILKVKKELPRFKNETSYETWVTSIFIHICRELSDDTSLQVSEGSEQHKDLFKALYQLKQLEKDAVVLTYIKGIPKEETAQLLQVSVEKLKEHLFSGIQSLKKELGYGSSFNGCKEYHKDYIDYLDRTLDRSKKIELEKHIYHCQHCQEDLGTFQDVMLTMVNLTERIEDFHVPFGFMENVKAKLAERDKQRQQKHKKRKRIGIALASVLALLIGIEVFTRTFTNLYYTWTEEDPQLRAFLQQGLGERLNLEAESNGIKIRIKSAIADDMQTLVMYEIEDTAKDNQYFIDYYEGVAVENKREIMDQETYQTQYFPDIKSDENNKVKNVFHGKMSLRPLITDHGTIKLKITKLLKLFDPSSDRNRLSYENLEYDTGEWNFEIPVTKHPSIEYALDGKTEVEGVQVRFDKLKIAPTMTILELAVNNGGQQGKRIENLTVGNLEVNNKKLKADKYGSFFTNQHTDWDIFQTRFDSLFGEKPKEVSVQLESVNLSIDDRKNIPLNLSRGFPQPFEYAGSTISIDKVEIGRPTTIVISNHKVENRAYESFQFNIIDEDDNQIESMQMGSEGVMVDKNGTKYDLNQSPAAYEEVEQPRYFATVEKIKLHGEDTTESVIPKRLEIHGYTTTKYLDDVVKISLD